jgi:hypothetical protein
MAELKLPVNGYGNVDVTKGMPPGVCYLPPDAPLSDLNLAGVPVAKGLTGFTEKRRQWYPDFSSQLLAPVGWETALQTWRESEGGKAALRARDEQLAHVAAEKNAKRREVAQRAAAKRKRNARLAATDYGRLLIALREAQQASDRAKSRAANGCRRREYYERDNSVYSNANFRRSREARERDYQEKEYAVQNSVALAPLSGITLGWGARENEMYVVYFDLPTGQVSFHCKQRLAGPEYSGIWDGIRGVSGSRIEEAIRLVLGERG